MKDMNKIVASRPFKWAMGAIAEIILLLIVFSLGVHVGVKKANFSNAFGANYERNFAGMPRPMGPPPGPGMMGFFREGQDWRNPHGLAGTIISLGDNKIVITDQNNNEYNIATDERTIIKSRGGELKVTDLKSGDKIVVLGRPDDQGTIQAGLIRVFDGSQNQNQNNNNNNSNQQ